MKYVCPLSLAQGLEQEIEEVTASHRVGPLLFLTEALKLALKTEVKNWQRLYAKHLNEKCAREMDEILEFFDNMQKKLRYVDYVNFISPKKRTSVYIFR